MRQLDFPHADALYLAIRPPAILLAKSETRLSEE